MPATSRQKIERIITAANSSEAREKARATFGNLGNPAITATRKLFEPPAPYNFRVEIEFDTYE